MSKRFQVAISFAGPQRFFAHELNRHLQARGVKTFYDYNFKAELLGEFLPAKFHEIYGDQTDYAAILLSKDYVDRVWPRQESKIIIEKMMNTKSAFVLPILFDDTILPGLTSAVGNADARTQTAGEIANIIADKLGAPPLAKLSHVPPPHHTNLSDTLEFDYSLYDGGYILGDGGLSFETKWSSSGGDSIIAYHDGANILGVALAPDAKIVSDISDAGALQYSSRTQRPKIGEWVVFKNMNGAFCAANILDVRSRTHGSKDDYLKLQYVIAPDGRGDFSSLSP